MWLWRMSLHGTAEGATRAEKGNRVPISQAKGQSRNHSKEKPQAGPQGRVCLLFVSLEPETAARGDWLFCLPQDRKGYVNEYGSTGCHRKQDQRHRMERTAAVPSGRHGHRLFHPYTLRSGAQVRRRLEAPVRSLLPQWRKGRQGRHEPVPGADDRYRRAGRHRQHCGRGDCAVFRRPGRHLLDVAVRLLRYVHHLRRGRPRAEV